MTPTPPDNAIAAMVVLTALAIGMVLFVEFIANFWR
jgi:hypothetical protein